MCAPVHGSCDNTDTSIQDYSGQHRTAAARSDKDEILGKERSTLGFARNASDALPCTNDLAFNKFSARDACLSPITIEA
jgi:hypothetical protein